MNQSRSPSLPKCSIFASPRSFRPRHLATRPEPLHQPAQRAELPGVIAKAGRHVASIRVSALVAKRSHYGVTIPTILTTSKFDPATCRSSLTNASLFHLESGAPLINQLLPLSATIIP